MKATRPSKWILAAAIAALPIFAPHANAQYRVNQNGGALDANNRVGSGGVNTPTSPQSGQPTGNQIVTGNVTSGREFRWGNTTVVGPGGQVITRSNQPYFDQRDFQGNVAGSNVDNFIKNSAGVPGPNQGQVLPNQAQAFYGTRLAEAPPPGFAEKGYTGTYTPVSKPMIARDQGLLPRPGMFDSSPFLETPSGNELFLGVQDPMTNRPSMFSASPLLGLRPWNPSQSTDGTIVSPYNFSQMNALDRLRIDQRSILQMREELNKSANQGNNPDSPDSIDPSKAPAGGLAKPLPTPFDAPESPSLGGKAIDSSIASSAISGAVRRDQSMGSRFYTSPVQQSSQYAELQRRLERYNADRQLTDEDRQREFLKQLQARQSAEKTAQRSADPGLSAISGSQRTAGLGQPGGVSSGLAPSQPMPVKSLADGIKAPRLAQTLRQAEELTKQGKFADALDRYVVAEAVAPNNPLIWLGKAHAELGVGYYRPAENDLRTALTEDPSLLMGRYDLKGMLGQERLEFLVRDLKETARKQETDPAPTFLLAYLAYNSGSESSAGLYLNEVEKRIADRNDPESISYRNLVKQLRTHWNLSGEGVDRAGSAGQAMLLSEVLGQFESGNVASATLTRDALVGEFRSPVATAGNKEPVRTFKTPLPAGAATGPLAKWLQDHSKGVNLRIETDTPTTQPSK
ncbi:MAG: tetratricopeptide repeat protein [Bacillota bacterium]